MRKGYDYLLIAFIATVIAGLSSKIGAMSLNSYLFILISYTVGSAFAFSQLFLFKERLGRDVRNVSIKLGIIVGLVNFVSYFTLLSALSAGPGVIVFPLVGLSLALVVVFSIIFFKERLNKKGILGIILALVSLWLLR